MPTQFLKIIVVIFVLETPSETLFRKKTALIYTEKTRKDPKRPEKTRKDALSYTEKTRKDALSYTEKTRKDALIYTEKTREDPKRSEKTLKDTRKDPNRPEKTFLMLM